MVRFLAIGLVAGCAASFGLDSTELGADRDRDGVFDLVDNCPDDANADQRNTDGDDFGDACECGDAFEDQDLDGIGDECDQCPLGNDTYDEDGDTVADRCDLCPGRVEDGGDADLDGVGDACDSTVIDERRYFDGFLLEPNYAWHPVRSSPRWTSSGGAMHAPNGAFETAMELYAVRLPPRENAWVVEARILVPATFEPGLYVGLELFDTGFGALRCEIRDAATSPGTWEVVAVERALLNETPTTLTTLVPGTSVRLRMRLINGFNGTELECLVDGEAANHNIGDSNTVNTIRGVRMVAGGAASFEYLDVITRRPLP